MSFLDNWDNFVSVSKYLFFCISWIRAIPCQRSEKKGQRQKVDFFWWNMQDNKAIWWFWPFFEIFLEFWGVFSPKWKIPKNDCFEKVKIEEKNICFFLDSTTYFKYHIHHSYSMHFMILLVSFVVCNILDHFLPFHVFFLYCEKCVALNIKPFSAFQYLN